MDPRARLAAPLVTAIAATVLTAGAAKASTLPGASSVFPSGEFKLRNGVCLSYRPGEPLDGGDCGGAAAVVWTYKSGTQQLVARNGLCMGEWDAATARNLPVLETCDDSATDQKWGSYKDAKGYTCIYPASDAANAKSELDWDFEMPGGPPINDSKIIRRLYMHKLSNGVWSISLRETDVSADPTGVTSDKVGFSALKV